MPSPPAAYDRALELLARRPHFRAELAGKLARRGYGEEEVAAALARLAAAGLLDDAREARGMVAARLARGALGAWRLRAELARRGVAQEDAEAAVAELLPADDLPLARAAARRWARRGGGAPAALVRHLERRGFSRRAILRLASDLEEGADLTAEPS